MVYSVTAHPMNRECFMSSSKVSLSAIARMYRVEGRGRREFDTHQCSHYLHVDKDCKVLLCWFKQ